MSPTAVICTLGDVLLGVVVRTAEPASSRAHADSPVETQR